jgi:hypothetical protein
MLKRHIENTIGIGLDIIIFFLNKAGGGAHQRCWNLRMLDTMKDTKKLHKGCFWALVGLKTFYI